MSSLLVAMAQEELQSAASGQLHLWGEYYLADPLFGLLVPVAVAVVFLGRFRGRAGARTPVLPPPPLPRSVRQRLAWIPAALQLVALVLSIAALARPLRSSVLHTTTSEGVDIALVIDRSSSMQHMDLDPELTRLDVVKEVAGDFARRRMTDRVDASDNVALLTFARYPTLVCPFTLDVSAMSGFLDGVELVAFQHEDGTAIGVALAKAVVVIRGSDAKSKVIVLLTDGEDRVEYSNPANYISPEEAGELAAREGVRVYTVLAGRYVYVQDWFGNVHPSEHELDSSQLRAIADDTGGRFFRARDRQALEDVYAEIEELERTPREERRFVEHFDLYPDFLLWALGCYLGAWFSASTWARRLT